MLACTSTSIPGRSFPQAVGVWPWTHAECAHAPAPEVYLDVMQANACLAWYWHSGQYHSASTNAVLFSWLDNTVMVTLRMLSLSLLNRYLYIYKYIIYNIYLYISIYIYISLY